MSKLSTRAAPLRRSPLVSALTLAMAGWLLSGCGGGGSDGAPATPPPPAQSPVQPPAEQPTQPPVQPPPGSPPPVETPPPPPVPPATITLLAGDIGGHGWRDATGPAARFFQPADVAPDAAGNIYVADTRNRALRKISAGGTVTTVIGPTDPAVAGMADGPVASATLFGPNAVTVAQDGTVYIADGAAVRKIATNGTVSTVAGRPNETGYVNGAGTAARFDTIRDLVVDGAGNVYVSSNNTIRRIAPEGTVSTLAGSPGLTEARDGQGAAAGFASAPGLAFDASGNLLAADVRAIRRITPAGLVSTLVSAPDRVMFAIAQGADGTIYVSDDASIARLDGSNRLQLVAGNASDPNWVDGAGANARLNRVLGLAASPDGRLLVADATSNTIRVVAPAGQVSTLAGAGELRGHVDAAGAAARFYGPGPVATDAAGNVYLADSGNHVVRKITPDGSVTTLAGKAGVAGSADGAGTQATFNGLTGITVDKNGNVYVSNSANCSGEACTPFGGFAINTVRKITPAGVVTTLAGRPGQIGFADGTGSAATFSQPSGIDTDSEGNIYVADCGNGALRRITPAGTVSTVVRSGVCSSVVYTPMMGGSMASGLTVARDGTAYVADSSAKVIRKVTPNGTVSVVAGTESVPGAADGAGAAARFASPIGITLDAAGNLYVGDAGNNAVRRITPAGVVSTYAGQPGVKGVALGALPGVLSAPAGIDIGPDGTLYVSSAGAVLRIR